MQCNARQIVINNDLKKIKQYKTGKEEYRCDVKICKECKWFMVSLEGWDKNVE